MKKRAYCLCICFVATLCFAKAQEPFMRQLTVKDGLPQQQVMCYFKDSRGFLWLGTKNGLSRFDGKTFKNYNEEDGIPDNIVRSIGEDEQGNIWFTVFSGLVRFDGINFKLFRNERLGDASLTIVNSHKIFIHSQDWVLFENGQFVSKSQYFQGIDAQKIRKTYYDKPTGNMYVACGKEENVVIYMYQNGQLTKIGPPNLDFSNIQRLPSGELVFGRFIKGLEKGLINSSTEHETYRQNANGTFKLLCKKNLHKFELFEPLPYDVFTGFVREKTQYFIQKGKKGVFKPILNSLPEARFELNAFYEIRDCSFYINQLGYIWVDSEQGLWQVFNEAFELIKDKSVNSAWAVAEDNRQHLFFSTLATASIIEYDGQQFETIFDAKQSPMKIVGFYNGASKDGNGNLYFPHHLGILKYDGQQFHQLLNEVDKITDKNYYLYSYYDKERNWLLGGGSNHVKVFDLSKNTDRNLTREQGLHKSEETGASVKDVDGSIWLFGGGEVSHWQPETNAFKNYTITNKRGDNFGGVSACLDAKGTIWVGNAYGLCYFDRQKDAFQWVSTEVKHFFSAVANYDKDHLILGTTGGAVYFLDLKKWYNNKQVSLKLFNSNNGYQGGKIQQNGIFKDSKGDFWLLSGAGLVRLHPEQLNLNQGELPKVYIKKIDTFSLNLTHKTDTINLLKGQNYFNIEAGFIFYDPSVKTYFSYRLMGKTDTTWSAWNETPNQLFTDLASGIYTLEIKARPLGYAETAVDSIFIKVDLLLLQEPWFRRLMLILATLFAVGFVFQSLRNWYLNKQLEKNAQIVRQLEVQTLQSQMNPHFIYNILGSLQNVIYQNDTKTAEMLLLRLSTLIRRFLEASVSSNNVKNLTSQNETTLQEEINLLRIYIEFEQLVRRDKFTYAITVAENLDATNVTLPPIILQPFVENAIKHGILYKEDKGHLSLNFYKTDAETLVCDITDDGLGIKQVRALQAKSIKAYKSLSTDLIAERVKRLNLMGYNIGVTTENSVEGGTKVRVTFTNRF